MIERTHATLSGVVRRAVYSDCEKYRYELSITWDKTKPRLAFLMMNPSTATERENDNTVELCEQRTLRAKTYGGLDVLNVFAWRETDSKLLKTLCKQGVDLIGPENDERIVRIAKGAELVIGAWGRSGNLLGRGAVVLSMLAANGVPLSTFVINADGSPKHPLYVSYDTPPVPWEVAVKAAADRRNGAAGARG